MKALEIDRRRLGLVFVAAVTLLITGCGFEAGSALPLSVEGAWLGNGLFHAGPGKIEVQAQCEILSNGTYRLLYLKPGIMASTGMEKGNWERNGQSLTLTPMVEKPEAQKPTGSVFQALRKGSVIPPKTLTIAEDFSALNFNDGTLEIKFVPNPKATEKLRAAGDVVSP